jgi:ABC-2 type transport system permease protein
VTALRVFVIGGLTTYRATFYWLTPYVYIPSLLVAPIFQILLFVYIGRNAGLESDEFYVIGNALQYAAIPCVFAMGYAISGERFQQTLGPILASPAPRLPLYLGRAVPVMLNGAFVAAFSLAVGSLVVGIDIPASAWAPLAVVVLVCAVSCTGLGLINGAIGLRVREIAVLANIMFGLLLIFTGANVPIAELPGWMQAISNVIPLTHGIEAARILADGGSLASIDHLLADELLIGLVYGIAGYSLIRFFEWQSRVHATLEVA